MPSGYDPNDTLTAIYGVDFSEYRSNPINANTGGKRTYAAENMKLSLAGANSYDAKIATVSTGDSLMAGRDDFRGKGPFNIRECVTKWNTATGQHSVVAYKDEIETISSTVPATAGGAWYHSLTTATKYASNTDYDTMIEFPLFYYKRPSPYEFLVSSTQHEGFLPSPMHLNIGGTPASYCYVSKYMLNANYRSVCGTATKVSADGATARTTIKANHMYMMTYNVYYTIAMLMFVKYATLDVSKYIGIGTKQNVSNGSAIVAGTMNSGGSKFLSTNVNTRYMMDGFVSRSKARTTNVTGLSVDEARNILTLGLEDWYGYKWLHLEGLYFYNNILYVSKNPLTIHSSSANNVNATTLTSGGFDTLHLNIIDSPNLTNTGGVRSLSYFPGYPHLLIGSQTSSVKPATNSTENSNACISDRFLWDDSTGQVHFVTGCAEGANLFSAGPLCFDLAGTSYISARAGFRSFFLLE